MARKKRDTMVSVGQPGTNPDPSTTISGNESRINANTTNTSASGVHCYAFSPSYRWLTANNATYLANRTATRTFVRGYFERYSLVPSDDSVWHWRRLVISCKDGLLLTVGDETGAQSTSASTISTRKFRDLTGQTTGDYQKAWDNIQDFVFRGVKVTDWNDQMTAPVDKYRFNVHSDKLRVIKSGNSRPAPRYVKTYVPINKSICYDDEENGISVTASPYSIGSKPGIGDIYVLDFFVCKAPVAATTSALNISSTATYYWSER